LTLGARSKGIRESHAAENGNENPFLGIFEVLATGYLLLLAIGADFCHRHAPANGRNLVSVVSGGIAESGSRSSLRANEKNATRPDVSEAFLPPALPDR